MLAVRDICNTDRIYNNQLTVMQVKICIALCIYKKCNYLGTLKVVGI